MRVSFLFLFLPWFYIGFPPSLQAQDPHFSQFFANNQYLNPAFTAFQGGSSIHMQSRWQWIGIQQGISRFNTQSFAADTYLPDLGIGLGLFTNHHIEGEGQVDWTQAGISLSGRLTEYTAIPLKNFDLMFGGSFSYNQRTLRGWENLFFSENLDAVRGIVSNQPRQNFPIIKYPDFRIGGAVDFRGLEIGGSYKHLLQPADCPTCRLPRRKSFHALYVYEGPILMKSGASGEQQLMPFFRHENQKMGLVQENIAVDTSWKYYTNEVGILWAVASHGYENSRRGPRFAPFVGVSYRWQGFASKKTSVNGVTMSALILNAGFERNFGKVLSRFGLSYDFNFFSKQGTYLSALEFFLNMTFPDAYMYKSIDRLKIGINRRTCPATGRGGRKYKMYRQSR